MTRGEEGTWDAALRGGRMRVGARVFIDEGTAPGVIGRRAIPFFAVTSSHRTGSSYGVTPVEGRQQEQAVPAYALSKSTSWLADAARRSSGKMPSQQNRAQVLGDCDRADSEKALAQAKKENTALLKKQKLTVKESKVLATEHKVFFFAVGDKGLHKRRS